MICPCLEGCVPSLASLRLYLMSHSQRRNKFSTTHTEPFSGSGIQEAFLAATSTPFDGMIAHTDHPVVAPPPCPCTVAPTPRPCRGPARGGVHPRQQPHLEEGKRECVLLSHDDAKKEFVGLFVYCDYGRTIGWRAVFVPFRLIRDKYEQYAPQEPVVCKVEEMGYDVVFSFRCHFGASRCLVAALDNVSCCVPSLVLLY